METEAGRELDARIAEAVFGYTLDYEFADLHVPPAPHVKELRDQYDEWGVLPHYSSDIAAAWLVVEALRARGIWLEELSGRYEESYRAGFSWRDPARGMLYRQAMAATAPLAICRAALEALGS